MHLKVETDARGESFWSKFGLHAGTPGAMLVDGIIKAFIAFTDAVGITSNQRIEPSRFHRKYIPLKKDPDQAIKAALEATENKKIVKAANESTEWYVFVLTLNPHQQVNAWSEGLIHWSSGMTGIEWWGVL